MNSLDSGRGANVAGIKAPIQSTVDVNELARRLARRDGGAEANLQADVQTLLLFGGLNLGEDDLNVELEAPVGGGRRIDAEAGFTVIETKRDLRKGNVREEAEAQLAGYARWKTPSVASPQTTDSGPPALPRARVGGS